MGVKNETQMYISTLAELGTSGELFLKLIETLHSGRVEALYRKYYYQEMTTCRLKKKGNITIAPHMIPI